VRRYYIFKAIFGLTADTLSSVTTYPVNKILSFPSEHVSVCKSFELFLTHNQLTHGYLEDKPATSLRFWWLVFFSNKDSDLVHGSAPAFFWNCCVCSAGEI
jgi:hypothetical protein